MEFSPSDFARYLVTGTDIRGRRFRTGSTSYRYAAAINVWRGSLWGVKPNGKRVLITRYSN